MKNVIGIAGEAVVTILTVMKTFTISFPTQDALNRRPPSLFRMLLQQGELGSLLYGIHAKQ